MEGPIEGVSVSGTASALDVNAYEGASPLEISYSWSGGTSYSITPSDGFGVGGFTQGSANFSVVYTYAPTAPVPEPSTWGLMLVGFAGLGFLGCRGSRKRGGRAAASSRPLRSRADVDAAFRDRAAS